MKEENNNLEVNEEKNEIQLIKNQDIITEQNSNNNINEPLIKDDIIQINKNENEVSTSNPSQNKIEDKNNQQNNNNLINNENNQNNTNQNNNNNSQNMPIFSNNVGNLNSQMNYQLNPNINEIYNPLEVEETGCFSCCSYGIRSALFGCGCAWIVAFIIFYVFIFKHNNYYY